MKQKLWSQIRTQNGECGHKRINDEEKSEPLLKQIWFKNVDVKSKVTWEIHNLISTYNHPFIYNRKQWGAFQILFPGILCQSGSNAFIKIKKKKKKRWGHKNYSRFCQTQGLIKWPIYTKYYMPKVFTWWWHILCEILCRII